MFHIAAPDNSKSVELDQCNDEDQLGDVNIRVNGELVAYFCGTSGDLYVYRNDLKAQTGGKVKLV
jgi:hypothetical protein